MARTIAEHRAAIDSAEEQTQRAVAQAVRRFLVRVERAVRAGLRADLPDEAIIAASTPPELPLTLGMTRRWWAEEVDTNLITVLEQIWRDVFLATTDGSEILRTSLDNLNVYVAAVRDRLVEGLNPPLPDDAMDRTRVVIVSSAALGWSTAQTSRALATALQWEHDGATLRGMYEFLTEQIEAILDPLGPPGTPARENARTSDPRVADLQRLRSDVQKRIDNESTYWQTRATRIARTESTFAYNSANLSALISEGFLFKEWLATEDSRTRPSHHNADGQVVPIDRAFVVGGFLLQMPGDPTGPAHEVISCRCIAIGSDGPATIDWAGVDEGES